MRWRPELFRPPWTSGKKLELVVVSLAVAVLLVACVDAMIIRLIGRGIQQDAVRISELSRECNALGESYKTDMAAIAADLQAGRLTSAEALAARQQRTARYLRLSGIVLTDMRALIPTTKTNTIFALMYVPVVLLALLGLCIAATALAARRVRWRLAALGYSELTLADCAWLLLALRRRLTLVPPAADLSVIPGYTESADSVVEFVRLRQGGRSR